MQVGISPTTGLPSTYDYINNMGSNPIVLVMLSVILILYYAIFSSLGAYQGQNIVAGESSTGVKFIETLLWALFLMLLLLNGLRYFFEIDLTASIKNFFSDRPEIDIIIDRPEAAGSAAAVDDSSVPEITVEPQTFHIPDNNYSFNDAAAICKAYGARLATYDEIEDAYNKGGEWCGYGWSHGQMALYPTQKDTWNKLQTIAGHQHDCGRPGVNGGYIANPNVHFGINCFGYKPKITSQEQTLMEEDQIYPKTQAELDFNKAVDYWKQKLPEVPVAPFNHTTWSRI